MGGKKRKSVATSIDEVDRAMYSTFCGAANSLSHLYTQAMNQQKLTFHAGERHGLEKLYQWILRQQEEGSRVNTIDILSYLQTEIDCSGDDSTMSPRSLSFNPHAQPTVHLINSGLAVSSGPSVTPSAGPEQQTKNNVFSNALSSPVRRSLQNYHITQEGFCPNSVQPSSTVSRNNEPNNSTDSSMDMHADSPGDESTY